MAAQIPEVLRAQLTRIEDMLERADRVLRERGRVTGDRVDYTFVEHAIFQQEDNNARNVVFQIPHGTDFVAKRVGVYVDFRFVTPDQATNGPPDISYRPCPWTCTYGCFNGQRTDRAAADCMLSFSEQRPNRPSRDLQNFPIPVAMFYSASQNYRPADTANLAYYASFEFPSAMAFAEDYLLPGGSALRCLIAPNFVSVRSDPNEAGGDTTLQNEYRFTVTLEGYKVIS